MSRISAQRRLRTGLRFLALRTLLLSGLVVLATGCQQHESTHTVADYLHDQDAAEAALKFYSKDRGRYEGNPNWANASSALGKIQFLNECWPKKPSARFTTANTDHACLDAHGYKR